MATGRVRGGADHPRPRTRNLKSAPSPPRSPSGCIRGAPSGIFSAPSRWGIPDPRPRSRTQLLKKSKIKKLKNHVQIPKCNVNLNCPKQKQFKYNSYKLNLNCYSKTNTIQNQVLLSNINLFRRIHKTLFDQIIQTCRATFFSNSLH